MKVSEMYPSKYLKAEDFTDGETKVFTIKNYDIAEMTNSKKQTENKPVLSFREPNAKDLVLNKTNAAIIAKLYGDEADDWIGKKVALHAIEVESFGDVVRAIRVKSTIPAAVKPTDDDLFGDPAPHWFTVDAERIAFSAFAKGLGYNKDTAQAALGVSTFTDYRGTREQAEAVLAERHTAALEYADALGADLPSMNLQAGGIPVPSKQTA